MGAPSQRRGEGAQASLALSPTALPRGARLVAALPVGLMALLVASHGGYFGLGAGLCGLLASGAALILGVIRRRRLNMPTEAYLLAGVALACLASALAHTPSLTMLSRTGAWAAVAGFSLLVAAQTREERVASLWLLAWLGVLTAVLGLLVAAAVLPLTAGVDSGRLQFCFQYANAAGAWYGACTLLCLAAPDERLQAMTVLPACALLLTQSGGAVLAFVLVAAALAYIWARTGQAERIVRALLLGLLALLGFRAFQLVKGPAGLAVTAVLVVACAVLPRTETGFWRRLSSRMTTPVLLVVLAVVALPVLFSLAPRLAQASATFAERLHQIRDGFALALHQPLLGIGPDTWQFVYPYYQTAAYHTNVVHSSYVQLLLDAGLVGLGLLLAALARCMQACARAMRAGDAGALAALPAASLVLLHSLIDFDLQFGSLAALVALLVVPAGAVAPASQHAGPPVCKGVQPLASSRPLAQVRPALASVACLALCLLGLLGAASLRSLGLASARGDYAYIERAYQANPVAHADPAAREQYLAALYQQDRYADVCDAYAAVALPTDADAFYAALSWYGRGDAARGGEILVGQLERKPYDEAMLASSQTIVDAYGIDPLLAKRYEQAVKVAGRLSGT